MFDWSRSMSCKLHKDKPLRIDLILHPDSHPGCHRVNSEIESETVLLSLTAGVSCSLQWAGWLSGAVMGEWTILERLLEAAVQQHSTMIGRTPTAGMEQFSSPLISETRPLGLLACDQEGASSLIDVLHRSGPFDVIIHKLSDVMGEAEHDSQSQQLLERFERYTAGHPHTVLLDPLPAMRRLLDRFASYRIMEGLQTAIPGEWICSPPYMEINSTELSEKQLDRAQRSLPFPIICKTRVAHGSSSHKMSLIFGPAGLWDARPPCVLQSFINHSAVLHKVFVVGGAHFTVERPSLKNFPRGQSVTKLRSELGMSLFGVDVIVNTETGRHTVIDINIFPGYEGVPQFFSALLNHIEALLQEKGGACETRGSPDHPAKGGEVEVGASAMPPSTSTLIEGVSLTAAQRNIH
ncbi:Inositol-tetrakisphosphate 1-kinase [Acipenser ruthenus]|uniref:Inositol-tetrakisphosphate 1-kinase n=1 Tax=Acipenser ruthenus TaxID=7906 RepID=A0A662YR19_ACIRT|nr:Inositol-tetrakisphosphate 1-kinase [Acipenser ruthenus]